MGRPTGPCLAGAVPDDTAVPPEPRYDGRDRGRMGGPHAEKPEIRTLNLENLVRLLGLQIGLDLQLDADRSCRLVFDGQVMVDIEGVDDGVALLHSVVGLLPPAGRRKAIYEALLAGNLFGRDTGAAVLAVDADLGEILLFRRLDLDATDERSFGDALQDLVARATAWTGRLETLARSPEAAAPADLGAYAIRI